MPSTPIKSVLTVTPSLSALLLSCGQSVPGPAAAGAEAPEAAASAPVLALATPAIQKPPVQVAWSYNIGGTNTSNLNPGKTPSGKVLSLNLYDVSSATTTKLKAAGKYVICYYSAGTSENYWSDAQSKRLLAPALNLGEVQRGAGTVWESEKWLNIVDFANPANSTAATVRSVMSSRLDLARSEGCAAVEPDNVDAWTNDVSRNAPAGTAADAVSDQDQLAYNRWTADDAHARGLAVLLKNDLDQVAALAPRYDGALNESCLSYTECASLAPFRDAGKAIYVVEYHTARYVTTAHKQTATQLHLNIILTDENVERLDPYARFGA